MHANMLFNEEFEINRHMRIPELYIIVFEVFHSPVSGPCSGSWSFFLSVMSLWDTRNRTTSPFSFLMGTMSRRHQNCVPADREDTCSQSEQETYCGLWRSSPLQHALYRYTLQSDALYSIVYKLKYFG